VDFIIDFISGVGIVTAISLVLLIAWFVYRRRYRRIGPDEALIVYGSRAKADRDGFRVIVGGGTLVKPFLEEAETFPLHAMQLDVVLVGVLAGEQRTPVNVNGTATVKVPVGPEERAEGFPTVRKAAGNFLGLSVSEINDSLTKVVAGHLRTIVAGLSVAELYGDQARFTDELKNKAADEIQSLGYTFLSFVFESIRDDNGYLDSLGVPEIERARRDARISQANNDRDATLQEETARLQKEQRRFEVEADIAESEKALSLKRASIQEEVDVAVASAVKAGQLQAKTEDIQIAQLEAERQKKELDATVREQADAEKYALERGAEGARFAAEQEAEARKFAAEAGAEAERIKREKAAMALKIEAETEAEAERIRRAKAAEALSLEASAQAQMVRDVGLAEADAIRAKGEAEAESRRLLADALRLYNEAGVSLEALKVLPEIVAAAAEPLSRAGATTIISNGGDGSGGTGVSKLTADVSEVLSTTLPIIKQLTGVDLSELLRVAVTKKDDDGGPALGDGSEA
jgi:flotillin